MEQNIELYSDFCATPYRTLMRYVEQSPTFENKKADLRVHVFASSLDPLIAYFHTTAIPIRQARGEYTDSIENDVSEK